MLRIFFIFIILFIGCEPDNDSASLQIQSDIDTTVARIGDVLNLSIISQNVGERIVVFPDIQETESMEIRNKSILTKRNKPYQVSFQIVFWDTGSFTIPEYTVEILKADSTNDISFSIDSIDIKIISMLTGAEDTNLRPIKDPVALKKLINWYRWTLVTILFLLLLTLFALWRKRVKKEPLKKIEVSEYQSAKDIAIARLKELKKLISGDNKTFYSQSSFIIREFFENKFYVRALEMTTSEISEFESNFELKNDDFINLMNLLNRADLAKFAKFEFKVQDRQVDYKFMLYMNSIFDQ
ncbi:MAG: hypothetical protein MUP82_04665 [Candidatus Marinimicrobia bacterium]|nr:hypothetical protein [Candidatus Neomarinimicrobiota bacterium]